jgi:putative salt-induced outer membrane protein YdiY
MFAWMADEIIHPDPEQARRLLARTRMRKAILLLFIATSLFADDAPPPAKPWSTTLGAGLAITSGNSDTKNINVSFATKYDPKTRVVFKADALYLRGDANGVKQVDKAAADARYEFTVSDRTFTFAEVSYLRDPFKDIDYLIAPLGGFGYRLIKSDTRNLTVDAAAGAEVESGATLGRTSGGAVKAGENFDWAVSKVSKVTEKLTGIWKTNDFNDAFYHFDAGLTTTVTTRVELKVAYAYDYKNRPASVVVKKGDSALFAALLLKF